MNTYEKIIENLSQQVNVRKLIDHPEEVGLRASDLAGKSGAFQTKMVLGEYFAQISKYAGMKASQHLISEQWGKRASDGKKISPEWFDHRHHILYPDKWFTTNCFMHADNVMCVLPYQGTILDLCSGDGFYDWYFYRKHAREVTCVELGADPYRHATRLHKAANITYIQHDVLTYQPKKSYYDVVVIQNAIEHFTQEEQQIIFRTAWEALKPGGWFCGDTPAFPKQQGAKVRAHKNEWADTNEMRENLSKVFDNDIEIFTIEGKVTGGTIMFWRCKK